MVVIEMANSIAPTIFLTWSRFMQSQKEEKNGLKHLLDIIQEHIIIN